MNKKNNILENTIATMLMSDIHLTENDKERIKDCLDGKISFQEVIDELIQLYLNK